MSRKGEIHDCNDRRYQPTCSQLTKEQTTARNLKEVEAHFHNENPDTIEAAIDLYGETVSWEEPARGIVMKDRKEVLSAYRGIFRTVAIHSYTTLQVAAEQDVFDDQVGGQPGDLPFAVARQAD